MADQPQRAQFGDDGFDAARGAVRDGLAAQQNLEHLLKSPRIGPRALATVVDELRPGCAPLTDALELLVQILTERVADASVIAALRDFMRERTSQLEQALAKASESDMGAKGRLRLEADVRRLRPELEAVGELIDLLDAATTCSTTELDVSALASEAVAKLAPARRDAQAIVRVAVLPPPEHATLVADPRVVMPLIAMMLGFVTAGGATIAQLATTSDATVGTRLWVRAGVNNHASATPCIPPRIITPSMQVARYAAASLGATLSSDNSGESALSLPPGQGLHALDRPLPGLPG